jgi:hypothetical protein
MAMERMQILLTSEQRHRLLVLADERGVPVVTLIRDAIDATYPPPTDRAARMAAAERLIARRVQYHSPEELDQMLADRFDVPM